MPGACNSCLAGSGSANVDMLPAGNRLKKRKAFNHLFRSGKSFSNDAILMKLSAGEKSEPSRFGFGVSPKFSKRAVERNKIKRWMREAIRVNLNEIKQGYLVALWVNPKYPKEKLNFFLVENKIINLLKKAKVYSRVK